MFLNLLQHWQRHWTREDHNPPRPEPPETGTREGANPQPPAPGLTSQPARKE